MGAFYFQSVRGTPPPTATMAVGQFFNPKKGKMAMSPLDLISTIYKKQVVCESPPHVFVLKFLTILVIVWVLLFVVDLLIV